jgi:hypothetical protein
MDGVLFVKRPANANLNLACNRTGIWQIPKSTAKSLANLRRYGTSLPYFPTGRLADRTGTKPRQKAPICRAIMMGPGWARSIPCRL